MKMHDQQSKKYAKGEKHLNGISVDQRNTVKFRID